MVDNNNHREVSKQVEKSYKFGMLALFIGLAVVISGFYYRLFWLVTLVGLGFIVGFWKHRNDNSPLNGLCFIGIFIFLASIIAIWVSSI